MTITDKPTRILVFPAGAVGLLYKALWYYPVLIFTASLAAVTYDYRWLHRPMQAMKSIFTLARASSVGMENDTIESGRPGNPDGFITPPQGHEMASGGDPQSLITPQEYRLKFSWKFGTAIITALVLTSIVVIVLRSVLHDSPILYKLFASLYLAGTIIFGGGPVVVPLPRQYIVVEG